MGLLHAPIGSLRSPLPPLAVNVNQSHVAGARVLGTFSHTTCFRISCAHWGLLFRQVSNGGSYYAVTSRSLPRYGGERSTSANHTSLSLVFLGRFPIRPVTQSASSCGLASWTGQQGGPRERWKGHKTYNDVDGHDYQILLEADFLVNADESHMGAAAIRNFRDHVFKTATGTHLLETIYL